ncbi:RhoGEF domain-containing protein [Apiospora aurea]|uniref:RhoGEF domain-containing protein n=1 Tax=Apiospora aurea TaxID=335848 RepID=A0ABR1PW22_9PEZI
MEAGNRDEEDRFFGPSHPLNSADRPFEPQSPNRRHDPYSHHYPQHHLDDHNQYDYGYSPEHRHRLDQHHYSDLDSPGESSNIDIDAALASYAANNHRAALANANLTNNDPLNPHGAAEPDDFYKNFHADHGNLMASTMLPSQRHHPGAASTSSQPRSPPASKRTMTGNTTSIPSPASQAGAGSRNGGRSSLRSVSAPVDEPHVDSKPGSKPPSAGGKQPSVKDLKKRFDQNTTAYTSNSSSSNSASRKTGIPRVPAREGSQPPTPSNYRGVGGSSHSNGASPSTSRSAISREATHGSSKSTSSARTTQRNKYVAEDHTSSNSQSFASRIAKPRGSNNSHHMTSKSMNSLSPTSPTLPTEAPPMPSLNQSNNSPSRPLLFGELPPGESDVAAAGFGIEGSSPALRQIGTEMPTEQTRGIDRLRSLQKLIMLELTVIFLETSATVDSEFKSAATRLSRIEVINVQAKAETKQPCLFHYYQPSVLQIQLSEHAQKAANKDARQSCQNSSDWSGRLDCESKDSHNPVKSEDAHKSNDEQESARHDYLKWRSKIERLHFRTSSKIISAIAKLKTPPASVCCNHDQLTHESRRKGTVAKQTQAEAEAAAQAEQAAQIEAARAVEEAEVAAAIAAVKRQQDRERDQEQEQVALALALSEIQRQERAQVEDTANDVHSTVADIAPEQPALVITTTFENAGREKAVEEVGLTRDSPTLGIPGSFPMGSPQFQDEVPLSAVSNTTEFDGEPQTEPPLRQTPLSPEPPAIDNLGISAPQTSRETPGYRSPFEDLPPEDDAVSFQISFDPASPDKAAEPTPTRSDFSTEPDIPGSYRDDEYVPQPFTASSYETRVTIIGRDSEFQSKPKDTTPAPIVSEHPTQAHKQAEAGPSHSAVTVQASPLAGDYDATATPLSAGSGDQERGLTKLEEFYVGPKVADSAAGLRDSTSGTSVRSHNRTWSMEEPLAEPRFSLETRRTLETRPSLTVPRNSGSTNRASQNTVWTDYSIESRSDYPSSFQFPNRDSVSETESQSHGAQFDRDSRTYPSSRGTSPHGSYRGPIYDDQPQLPELDTGDGFLVDYITRKNSVPYPVPVLPDHSPPPHRPRTLDSRTS